MNLPSLSIRRPVFASMLSAVLILFGYISYENIAIDRFPKVDFPLISITTVMQGADPDVISASITSTVETSVNAVPGIDRLTSFSRPNASTVILKFNLNKDIDIAFNEVQAKVNQIISQLPEKADTPIVQKLEVGGSPIMQIVLTGDRTLQQLNLFATNVIKKRLETIDGVGQVSIEGERKRTIRIELDTNRMAAFDITPQDLIRAFQTEHVQVPGGFMVSDFTENLLNLDLEYHSPKSLKNLVVTYRDQMPIYLKEIATVKDGLEDFRALASFNGEPSVGLGIIKVSGANTVEIIDTVKKRLKEEVIPQLPAGMKLSVASDEGEIINEIIDTLKEHLIFGTFLAALVVLAFLQSVRSTLIIAVTIPVSLLGAVAAMYFAGYTFNVITMLALLLLIGVVVDDAIVVLENIYRKMEVEGETDKVQAALTGTQEVMFAVFAATMTLVCIFVPVIFLGGIVGRFFQSFAVVVTVGVLISYFVALTLTPMLCSRYLHLMHSKLAIFEYCESLFSRMEKGYSKLITWSLNNRAQVVIGTILIVVSTGFVSKFVAKEFLPALDEGQFVVSFKTPLGSNVSYSKERMVDIEKVLNSYPEVKNYFSSIGSGNQAQVYEGKMFVTLVPQGERSRSQKEIMRSLRQDFAKLAGVKAFPTDVSLVGGGRGEPLQFIIKGQNLDKVSEICSTMLKRLNQIPSFGYVDLDLQLDLPQFKLKVDRERAQSLGLSTSDIAQAVAILAGGYDVAKYNDETGSSDRYDIRLKAKPGTIVQREDITKIYLRTPHKETVRLDTVVQLIPTTGPATIFRSNLQYGGMFFATPEITLGEAITHVKEIAAELLPAGYTISLEGQAKEFQSTAKYIAMAMLLAVTLVYMVLASQFNSFIQPLVIMVAQPLAIIGGVFALWITGDSLNIYSMIGMVLLMGLVAKNSILLVDLTNRYREEGDSINTALSKACPERMRPVLMTSFTVILAMLPAALGQGAGADSNGPLSIAVIGGMISSTFLTLVVIPAFYSLVENFLLRFEKDSN